jgi:phosphatidylglycerophosphatase C
VTYDDDPPSTGRVVVAWDVDGTIARWDTLIPFLYWLFPVAVLLKAGLPAIVAGHRSGAWPGTQRWRTAAKTELVHRLLTGRSVDGVAAATEEWVDRLVRKGLRRDTLRHIRWHADQGHSQVMVSAAFGAYLRPLARRLGIDDVVATELEIADGRYTGALATPNCRGEQKAERLRAHLAVGPPAARIWAYGNSAADRWMLALADVPVLVPRRPLPPPYVLDPGSNTP